MNVDPGILGFLALLAALAMLALWSARRARSAERFIVTQGYRAAAHPPAALMQLVSDRLGGEATRVWSKNARDWVLELLPRPEDDESTLRIVVTVPLETPFDGCLLLRAWQGAAPDRLPGRLGAGLLELGDARLAGLQRLPDPDRRLAREGSGYLAYAGSAITLEAELSGAFLDRLPSLAQTVWTVVVSGTDLLLLAPLARAREALAAAQELAVLWDGSINDIGEKRP